MSKQSERIKANSIESGAADPKPMPFLDHEHCTEAKASIDECSQPAVLNYYTTVDYDPLETDAASMDNTVEHGCSWKMEHFFWKVIGLLFMLRPVFWDSLNDLRCPSISLEFCKTTRHVLLSSTLSTKIVTLSKTLVASKNGTTSKNEQKRNDSLRSPSSKKIRKKTPAGKIQLSWFINKIIPVYGPPTDNHNYNEITDDIKYLFPAIESRTAAHSCCVTGKFPFSYNRYSSEVLNNDYSLETAIYSSAGPGVGYSCCNVVGSALITPPSHTTLVT